MRHRACRPFSLSEWPRVCSGREQPPSYIPTRRVDLQDPSPRPLVHRSALSPYKGPFVWRSYQLHVFIGPATRAWQFAAQAISSRSGTKPVFVLSGSSFLPRRSCACLGCAGDFCLAETFGPNVALVPGLDSTSHCPQWLHIKLLRPQVAPETLHSLCKSHEELSLVYQRLRRAVKSGGPFPQLTLVVLPLPTRLRVRARG